MDHEQKTFIDNLNKHVIEYTLAARKNDKSFKEGVIEIVEGLQQVISAVIASAAITLDMDREKFVLYLHEITKEIKQKATAQYDSQETDPPRQLGI
jgi:hypothetical protein